jgi:foldase protein PrsA
MFLKSGIDALGLDDRTAEGRSKINRLKEGVISDLIDRALIEAEARRRNLSPSDVALSKAYQKAVSEMGGEASYRAYLSENGLTDDEFRQMTLQETYGELLRDSLNKDVAVSEDEIRDFYEKEKTNTSLADLFNQPERVSARHILVSARPSEIASEIQWKEKQKFTKTEIDRRVAREITARRARAEAILAKVRSGADFDRLAQEYSDDAATKNRGGDLGSFKRNSHVAQFDDVAFALKEGETSGVVQTEYGFHIIKVIEHQPARLRTLGEARPATQQELLARKQAAHLRAWLEARRREGDIRIEPVYRTQQHEALGRSR